MANPVQSGPGATGTIMPTLLPVRLAIVVGALIIMGSMGACGINPTVTVRSPTPRVHYCYNADTCPKKDETVSDSPPRAFRNASGIVHLYSSESRGARALVGTDLNGSNFPGLAGPVSTRDCNVFYNSTASGSRADPALWEASEWVQGAAVAPDGSIHALVHNEWHPDPGSPAGAYANCSKPDCWVSYITEVVSRDGGQSFQHAAVPPHHLVASLPEKYRACTTSPFAFCGFAEFLMDCSRSQRTDGRATATATPHTASRTPATSCAARSTVITTR